MKILKAKNCRVIGGVLLIVGVILLFTGPTLGLYIARTLGKTPDVTYNHLDHPSIKYGYPVMAIGGGFILFAGLFAILSVIADIKKVLSGSSPKRRKI